MILPKSKQKQAVFQYKNTILQAFEDVENSLISVQTYEKEVSVLAEQVNALQEIMDLSNKRYEEGVTSYLEVLENERSLLMLS